MNDTAFQFINQFAGQYAWLDKIMIFTSEGSPYLLAVLLIVLWFRGGNKQNIENNQRIALLAMLSTVSGLLVNQIINLIYWHPRPFVEHSVHQLVAHAATESSFASDHTIVAFAVAFILYLNGHKLRRLVFVFAMIAAVSRVFVGVHYPLDVIGGAVIACASSFLLYRNVKKIEPLIIVTFKLYALITKPLPFFSRFAVITENFQIKQDS